MVPASRIDRPLRYSVEAPSGGFPFVEQIVQTGVALNAFIGILLGISTAEYNKGK